MYSPVLLNPLYYYYFFFYVALMMAWRNEAYWITWDHAAHCFTQKFITQSFIQHCSLVTPSYKELTYKLINSEPMIWANFEQPQTPPHIVNVCNLSFAVIKRHGQTFVSLQTGKMIFVELFTVFCSQKEVFVRFGLLMGTFC